MTASKQALVNLLAWVDAGKGAQNKPPTSKSFRSFLQDTRDEELRALLPAVARGDVPAGLPHAHLLRHREPPL